MRILKGHTQSVRSLAYSPDNRYLASGDEAGEVRLWDLHTSAESEILIEDKKSIEALVWTSTHSLVLGDGIGKITLWNAETKQYIHKGIAYPAGVRSLEASSNKLLAVVGWDNSLRMWHGESLREVQIRDAGGEKRPLAIADALAVRNVAFLSTGETLCLTMTNGVIALGDTSSGVVLGTLPETALSTALACSPNDNFVAVGTHSGEVRIWDLAQSQQVGTLRGHAWAIIALAFASNRHLISASVDGTVRAWDVANQQELQVYRWHKSWVTSMALSPNRMTAAAGSEDKSIVVWDLADLD